MLVYYSLPAHLLVEGVSTDDGQDVLGVDVEGDLVTAVVYTPRPDKPHLDEANRAAAETRVYSRDRLVSLATFDGTAVDLSNHPQALRQMVP